MQSSARESGDGDPSRHETEAERLDRNLTELLGGLRVALPGVQVLFAFLLVVPFNQGWSRMTDFERKLYYGTLLCTALATMLLIAPVVHHRLVFRHHEKGFLVATANRLSTTGMATMAMAMTGAVALITHVEFRGSAVTTGVAAAVGAGFAGIWFVLPLAHMHARRGP